MKVNIKLVFYNCNYNNKKFKIKRIKFNIITKIIIFNLKICERINKHKNILKNNF